MVLWIKKWVLVCLLVTTAQANDPSESRTSLADIELTHILALQDRLFTKGSDWNEEQLTLEAQKVLGRYEVFLVTNPTHLFGHILLAKFLQQVGQKKEAIAFYLKADALNPNIAVVKQQIGNFLAEQGKPREAFPFFLLTTRLSPEEPAYHFELGNFIFIFHDKLSMVDHDENLQLDQLMHESFREATRLEPTNFNYALRFAQSYFDLHEMNPSDALGAWTRLSENFKNRSILEKDYFRLCQARLLIELERFGDANKLIHSVHSSSLEQDKHTLLKKASAGSHLKNKNLPKKASQLSTPQKSNDIRSSILRNFPIDENLQKIKRIAQTLREEKLLKTFEWDVAKAKFLSNGEISLELTTREIP